MFSILFKISLVKSVRKKTYFLVDMSLAVVFTTFPSITTDAPSKMATGQDLRKLGNLRK